ncbi:MAG: hypothetical protein JRF53_04475 [Deltaproteobacteria bacterium]|nr:hypothetical protein [Deltaproteobacteria bacterium]MBW2343259.1 hypothetical protein [Deltaproteobacteria bacterium]
MKCPKCAYISFDHNQVCPKCSKDISAEQRKLNLPAFRPDPPSLLGALTGEASDSNVGLNIYGSGEIFTEGQETAFSPEDSQTIEAMEEAFEDSQGLEMQIEATPEPGIHFPADEGAEEVSSDLEDLVLDADEAIPKAGEVVEEEIVSLDFDDLSGDETEIAFDEELTEGTPISDLELGDGEDEISLEPEALFLEDTEISPATETGDEEKEISLDFSDLSIEESESDKETVVESEEELAMDLDDLLLDETEPEEEVSSKGISLDTGELVTSEIDMKKLKDSDDKEDFELELEPLETEDK